jgi:hypothetical protein
LADRSPQRNLGFSLVPHSPDSTGHCPIKGPTSERSDANRCSKKPRLDRDPESPEQLTIVDDAKFGESRSLVLPSNVASPASSALSPLSATSGSESGSPRHISPPPENIRDTTLSHSNQSYNVSPSKTPVSCSPVPSITNQVQVEQSGSPLNTSDSLTKPSKPPQVQVLIMRKRKISENQDEHKDVEAPSMPRILSNELGSRPMSECSCHADSGDTRVRHRFRDTDGNRHDVLLLRASMQDRNECRGRCQYQSTVQPSNSSENYRPCKRNKQSLLEDHSIPVT